MILMASSAISSAVLIWRKHGGHTLKSANWKRTTRCESRFEAITGGRGKDEARYEGFIPRSLEAGSEAN